MDPARALLPVVPPGEADLPSEFGPPMESQQHRDNMNVLVDSLRRYWSERDDIYIAGNMALYFNEMQVERNDFLGPDVFVVRDTTNRRRKSWVVWQEGSTPDLVIELLSPSTEADDRGKKMKIYARVLRVPEYFLFDPWDGRFEGYQLDSRSGEYVPMLADAGGGYGSEVTGLRLAPLVRRERGEITHWLRWWTPEGALVQTGDEAADEREARVIEIMRQIDSTESELESERARTEAERARADSAESRAAALAAKLRALGIDPDGV